MILVHKFVVVEGSSRHKADLKKSAEDQSFTMEDRRNSSHHLDADGKLGAGVGLLIGMGSGLLIGGMSGLLHDRFSGQRHTMTRLTPYFGIKGVGISLERRF